MLVQGGKLLNHSIIQIQLGWAHCPPGSPVYVAPEVLRKDYCSSADLWSAGIIAYMLLTARLPWHGSWAVGVADLYAGAGGHLAFADFMASALNPSGSDP